MDSRRGVFYSPLTLFFMAFFLFLVVFLFVLVHVGIISIAMGTLGLSPDVVFLVLMASLFGAWINIPVKKIESKARVITPRVRFFGFEYVVPVFVPQHTTIIAVNLGGAIVPALVSLYLLYRFSFPLCALLAVLLSTLFCYWVSRPLPGVGIVVPSLVVALFCAATSILLCPPELAPATAYVSGCLGVLIGADVLRLATNPDEISAPVVSIGGAGTFDGIFLCGVMAVLLASIV